MPHTTAERDTPSVYLQAKKLVRDAVKALKLDGLNEKEIVVRDGPWNHASVFRGITVWGNKVTLGDHSTNIRNVLGYAVVLSMVRLDESSPAGAEINDRFPLWKTVLFRRFHYRQLPGLDFEGATHLICTVQDSSLRTPANHPDANKYQGDQLIVWYWVREPQDLGE